MTSPTAPPRADDAAPGAQRGPAARLQENIRSNTSTASHATPEAMLSLILGIPAGPPTDVAVSSRPVLRPSRGCCRGAVTGAHQAWRPHFMLSARGRLKFGRKRPQLLWPIWVGFDQGWPHFCQVSLEFDRIWQIWATAGKSRPSTAKFGNFGQIGRSRPEISKPVKYGAAFVRAGPISAQVHPTSDK